MSIDESIVHEKELAKEIYIEAMLCHANPDDGRLDDCIERGKYHEQVAEWLEQLKDYRDKNKLVVHIDVENMESVKDKINKLSKEQYKKGYADGSLSVTSEIRNKVIDVFSDRIIRYVDYRIWRKLIIRLKIISLCSSCIIKIM